jgi:adenylate kinase
MRLILLGCPGAGKGTQATFITQKYHIPQISTGAILRAAIQAQTELGKQVKALVDGGQLVPDAIVEALVFERVKEPDCHNGFLLDGFPRTVAQADALHKQVAIDYVIDIDVPAEEIIERLTGRRIHPASGRIYHLRYQPPKIANKDDVTGEELIQRPDDSEEVVRRRLAVYEEQTRPLRAYYEHFKLKDAVKKPEYVRIDGRGSVEEIKDRIFAVLN